MVQCQLSLFAETGTSSLSWMTTRGAAQCTFFREGLMPSQIQALWGMCCDWYVQNIVSLRCNNGIEYLSQIYEGYLKTKGIHHELAVTYSNEQNGVVEWMNKSFLESARSMMVHTGLLDKSCPEPMQCAAYIINLTPMSAIKSKKSPLEVWSGRKPDVYNWKFLVV